MKISGVGSGAPARGARRAEKSDGKAFRNALAEAAAEGVDSAPPVGAVSGLGAVDALLAVQSMGDATEHEARRRMIKRGEDILDKLEEIRHGLLLGTLPREKLEALAQSIRVQRETCPDPGLASLLDEIELRAEVELAKLSR